MIEYIVGKIDSLSPTATVIETSGGIGYRLEISLPVYSQLSNQKEARLLVHEAIREDAWTLYGFLDEQERDLFRSLIGVSGVGVNTARVILSSIPAKELERVISTGDYNRLKTIKGIGAKTAQRIIVDLKDKIKPADDNEPTSDVIASMTDSGSFEEALAALVMLGFNRQQSFKVLRQLYTTAPSISVEEAIKQALARL
ncbi:MAG: Holliday junction branch migration protein RuvA [Muribaculaceae bacterium]|nr:Holliday junction branch migration protein RuvA [Muribaculaceae bacterium]